jgi:hypothetical protein
MDTYKLQLRIGPHEFCAEGPVNDVRQDFDMWKRMIQDFPNQTTVSPVDMPQTQNTPTWVQDGLPIRSEVERLYLADEKRGIVSLRILPRSEERNAEALLLVLLGYRVMLGAEEVAVTSLRPALKQSGCSVDRVDSIAEKNVRRGILNKGGRGKGGKYSLTNSGIERARGIATELLNS